MSKRLSQIESHIPMPSTKGPQNLHVHPTLNCTLKGHTFNQTTQFRNLKYANIPARFKDSIPNDTLKVGENGIFDATHFGPSCPHRRGAQKWDLTLTGENLRIEDGPGQGDDEKMSEFECLHVNVTVPNAVLSSSSSSTTAPKDESKANKTKGLPVFVWIHGGGLCMGSNSWPQYDFQRFCERSVRIGKPVIVVSMNYRLSVFGFMASDEIGAKGNMGYKDQVLAFRWVKKHIAGFGGDPGNVTAAGESAGGISLSTLLCADVGGEGLFERVVVMSGEATLRKSRNKWWHQQMYEQQAGFLGLEKGDKEGLRKKLLETDAIELAQTLPLAQHVCAVVDRDWLKEDANLTAMGNAKKSIHKPSWCKEFVVGDTAHDGTVLRGRIPGTPDAVDRLKAACSIYLPKDETQRLLEAYKLHGTPSPEKEKHMIMAFASEVRFYQPSMVVHQGWKAAGKQCSRYHFHVPNPFEGMNHDLASHELDVVMLTQNFNDQLDERNRKIAQSVADQFLKYINGEGWVEDGKILVYGYDGINSVPEDEYDQKYRGGRGAVLKSIEPHKLWRLADVCSRVRQEEEEFEGVKFPSATSTA